MATCGTDQSYFSAKEIIIVDWEAFDRSLEAEVSVYAEEVDRTGSFPLKSMAALRDAGVLGLTISDAHGGGGGDLNDAATVVEKVAGVCGSTAMVTLMHFAACAVIERHGDESVRRSAGEGQELLSLAFSESGSRSHFWAPAGTATIDGDEVVLDASKSWVTSAADATRFVWSSRPSAGDGAMTLWLVSSDADGLAVGSAFDGLGLRGNGSVPVTASGVRVSRDSRLGTDGDGLEIALATALPWFLVLTAAFAIGTMEAVVREVASHITSTKFEHLDATLASQPIVRADLARMRTATDATRALLCETVASLTNGTEDAMLRVLEVKAFAGETMLDVTDLAMKVCGGAAFRKELGVERRFRDGRAARVMAPTTDALFDFIGRAITGMELFDS